MNHLALDDFVWRCAVHAQSQPAPGFDFTDPDLNNERLPVEELAELRRVAPIWWNEQPMGVGGFDDEGYWVVTKHKDVKEISRRSDIFSSLENTAISRYPDNSAVSHKDTGQFVLLNMDAPTTPTCARSSPARSRPGPSRRCGPIWPRVPRRSSRRRPRRAPATSSNRSPANCRCRPSPI